MAVSWLDQIGADDVASVGGKAASLGELRAADLPVPPAFVVTADTYRTFLEATGIDEELFAAVDVDAEEPADLATAAARAAEIIAETPVPEAVRTEILTAYDDLGGEPRVAVRSSATAEDLPDASFAGQQDTFLNVGRDALVERVKECWASLFTERAIYYRQEHGFSHADVDIAVVVQEMVSAEESGVMFTRDPSTGAATVIIEAAWGLGEAVVSGEVSPDNYEIDRETGAVEAVTVADKTVMHVRDEDTGETVERAVPDERREQRVLDGGEIELLLALAETIEDHYGTPQDVEWAMVEGDLYVLQSRPITTIEEDDSRETGAEASAAETDAGGPTANAPEAGGPEAGAADEGAGDAGVADGGAVATTAEEGEIILQGLGSSPGRASGPVRIVTMLDQLDKVADGDVIVTEMTTPDMVPAMKRAAGLVTDAGGMTSHAAIVSRELGVPAVVGTETATEELEDGQVITIDGEKGHVEAGREQAQPESGTSEEPATAAGSGEREGPVPGLSDAATATKPMTGTKVAVNISMPSAAERAADTAADGVGLLRLEHLVLSTNETPEHYVQTHGEEAYVDELVDGISTVADAFYPRPVRTRTLDAPTDEFRKLAGGEDEPHEHNPMLGYRGIRRSLDRPELFKCELRAFKRLYEIGYDNVEVMFPLVNDAEDVLRTKALMEEAGIDPDTRPWGVMVETPASAIRIEEICRTGVDFVSFGTNDLTQYVLAVDRNNERVADRFDELHPAVLELIGETIETCREYDVATSICGQAGSKPRMVKFLVEAGVTSISANVDAVRDVQQEVKRVEQRLLLESIR